MSQPVDNDPNTPKPADVPSPEAVESANVSASASAASEPTAASAASEASGDPSGEGGDDEGDEGDETEGTTQTAEGAPGEQAPRKKRRRRRKKKPGQVAAGVPGADGQPAEGGEGAPEGGEAAAAGGDKPAGDRKRPPRPKKERPERERPAFNVGDVVFGKVIEFTEDALFVDLSGKARAIFDLRELLITEDDVEEYNRADKKEADELAAARAASVEARRAAGGGGAAVSGEDVSDETGETPALDSLSSGSSPDVSEAPTTEIAVVAEAEEPTATEAAPEAVAVAEGAEAVAVAAGGEATEGASPEGVSVEGAVIPEGATGPQLPRVILEPGAPFVGLIHNDGGRGGFVVLTHHPKRVQKAKPIVAEASRSGSLVFGLVTGTIKGGVEVDVDGLRAFAPASHVELRPGADLSHLVGKRLPFAVTQYAKRGRDVVLSRRAMLEGEAKEKREEALKKLEMNAVVDGVVRTVVPFGAFVDVGGVEGLVPLSEMSHNRADQPKDVFKVGETTRVRILRVDEKGKLWLSRRQAIDDPWNAVAEKYAQGTRHKGKVVRLQPFGAFVELESGIDGLIHAADLSIKRIEHPEEVVKIGDELDVVVAHVDVRQHRIALHPAPTGEAADETPQRIQVHKTVKVVVVNIESGGLVVRVRGATGRNARGFVSAAATGTPRGTELRKLFPVGKELEVKIIEHDPRRGELKLSIKALNEDNERNAYQQYRAQVKREAKFGTLADLLTKRNVNPTK